MSTAKGTMSAEEIEKVEAVIENEADTIATEAQKDLDDGEKSGTEVVTTVAEDSEKAADVVEDEINKAGVTLTDEEKDALADAIASRVADKLRPPAGETDTEPAAREPKPPRKPDRAPKSTHWSERPLFGGKG